MRWNSIRTKLILFMLIATIVPTVATMIISYSYTTDSLEKRAIEQNHQLMFQGKTNLANFVDNLNRASLTIYTDYEFYRQLDRGYDDYTFDSYTYVTLQNMASSMNGIWQVYFYRTETKRASLVIQSVPRRIYDAKLYEDTARYAEDGIQMQPTHLSHTYGFSSSPFFFPSVQVFTLHRPIYRIPANDRIGMLSVDVKLESLAQIVDQLYTQEQESIYLLDDSGHIFYADDRQIIGQQLEANWYNREQINKMESSHFEQDGAIFIHERVTTPLANWTLVKKIPKSYLLQEANQAAVINMLLIALSLIVIILATIIVSFRISKPIRQLVRYINQVQTGNLRVDIQPVSNDEIGVVLKRFRNMMDMINNLILREYQLELANKSNQLKALQAQINPHFMNNALQSIGTQALQHNAPHIYKLVTALGKMMRYSMYTDKSTATVQEELEHVKAYLQLQLQRFEDTFQAFFDIDERTLDNQVPKMTMQPLVENYFKHGIDRSVPSGQIAIRTRYIERTEQTQGMVIVVPYLQLIVEDNGRGMTLMRRIELNERLKEVHPEQLGTRTSHTLSRDEFVSDSSSGSPSSIGLVNVLARLQLFTNGKSTMRVEEQEPQGTRIVIELELEREN
ncbi:cache domain-containing sensor histidine kinase [Paenibacillus alvei]|uniref:Putative sensor with HAMP domain-containing protein n=1 Tax=Paenibacillus alvei TaxID=44250 RepID=A0A383RM50_PAEAL|nr:sensor histidine kinase [Paenibacillus alvei]SYX87376.1 putative sensor with HAMP domain-containing protein [Paenibacillus alvei]